MENDSVCSLNFLPNVIYLQGFEEKSALIMKDSRYFKKWTGHQEFKCQFVISSSPSSGLGLFAVIQRMSLRRDEEGNCIDYVKVCYLFFIFSSIYFILNSFIILL